MSAMVIVYNPKDGAPIKDFVTRGIKLNPHFPDGYKREDGQVYNGLVQYNEEDAKSLLDTYGFLIKMTPVQAKEILDRPPAKEFKCDYPGCEFSTTAKIGLAGHQRTHKNEAGETILPGEPVIDANLIPVGGGQTIRPRPKPGETPTPHLSDEERKTQDGVDPDGVEWYGGGAVETKNPGFGADRPSGQAHFRG